MFAMTRYSTSRTSEHSPSRLSGGFTLIEVLVVLAILTMLFAILVPSLQGARRQMKKVQCLSNLREIARGWNTYLNNDDNKGRFPKGINVNWNYGGKQGAGSSAFGAVRNSAEPWSCETNFDPTHCTPKVSKPLNRSLGYDEVMFTGPDVFRCPSDEGGSTIQPTFYDWFGTSYETNPYVIGPTRVAARSSDPCQGLKIELNKRIEHLAQHQIHNPERVILVGDAGWRNAIDYQVKWKDAFQWHGSPAMHSVAFVSGNAEFIRIRKGIHVSGGDSGTDYSVIPYGILIDNARSCQQELIP